MSRLPVSHKPETELRFSALQTNLTWSRETRVGPRMPTQLVEPALQRLAKFGQDLEGRKINMLVRLASAVRGPQPEFG
jgi:hypothetical protein